MCNIRINACWIQRESYHLKKRLYKLCFLSKEKSEKLKSHVMWGILAVAVLRFSGETICLSGSDIMQTSQSDIYFSYGNVSMLCQISKHCTSPTAFFCCCLFCFRLIHIWKSKSVEWEVNICDYTQIPNL